MRLFSFFLFILISTTTSVSAQTVYKTRTGKKYHVATCQYIRHGATAIKIEEARKLRLGACLRCKPDVNAARSANTFPRRAVPAPKTTSPPSTGTTTVQCKGTTQAGNRCKRKTKNKSGYCYQHG